MPGADFFISHAHEDRDEIARPLAQALLEAGFSVWFDDFSLRLGDSLRRSIDKGLSECRFGVVILSPHFFEKQWPQWELDGLMARETDGEHVILPLWHRITFAEVRRFSPMLAGRYAISTDRGLSDVVDRIVAAVRGETPWEEHSGIEEELQFHAELVHLRSTLLFDAELQRHTWEYLHDTTYRFHVEFNEPLKFGVYAWSQSDMGVVKPVGTIKAVEGSRLFTLNIKEYPTPGGSDFEVVIEPLPVRGDWMMIRQHFRSPSFNAIFADHAPETVLIHRTLRFNCIDGSEITSRVERFLYRLSFPAGYPVDPDSVVPIVGSASNSFDRVDERETRRVQKEGRITRHRDENGTSISMDVTRPRTQLFYGFAWNAPRRVS